jgi:beta-aspartyl-peptidase (threonine type)
MSLRTFIPITFLLAATTAAAHEPVIAIHGGAGTIRRAEMTPEREQQYRVALSSVVSAAHKRLSDGMASLDVVELAVRELEDSPLFNAGKGAVFTREGRNELDAAIVDGRTGNAGAVTGVTILKNPISAARAVMEKSPHVLLAGRGAEVFAAEHGIESVDPSYFWTERRWKALQDELRKRASTTESKSGTVGAVALDGAGNLAAATSTGGTTGKLTGRVGDTPLIGAGTYADNDTCAVSGTGQGEFFIRGVIAYQVAARMRFGKESLALAAQHAIDSLTEAGGEGGVIAVDAKGNVVMPFNTEGMYRAWVGRDGVVHVEIYK